jgi:ABC-type multidrug transport system ATPase subunit
MLAGKTRLMITHNITHLQFMDKIVVMKEGKILKVGTYQELLLHQGDFGEFLNRCSDQVLRGSLYFFNYKILSKLLNFNILLNCLNYQIYGIK